MKIQVIDITSHDKDDDFNDVMENTVNQWEEEQNNAYRIKDVIVFGFEYLKYTEICHAKVMIKYE